MNYKSFPNEYWTLIEKTIFDLRQNSDQKLFAAFDADGTLWDTDLGENFFQYQIEHKHVPLPPEPYQEYLDKKIINNDPRSAYVWLAEINEKKTIEQVRSWAQNAFSEIMPKPIFSEQKKLIDLFLKNNIEVVIVTASIKWAVEPGARALGLKNENVLGVETEVVNGIVTKKAVLPITYRQGKVEALLKYTNGIYPFFASGNSSGDIELLESATHVKLAVSAASRDEKLFKSEKELTDIAVERKWLAHRFI
jgi:phosphoserine phosphatase